MVSRDQAEKAANSILKPSRDELNARKDGLTEVIRRRASPVYPAGAATLTTHLAIMDGATAGAALMIGTIAGWGSDQRCGGSSSRLTL